MPASDELLSFNEVSRTALENELLPKASVVGVLLTAALVKAADELRTGLGGSVVIV